jgi:hypothetical protein
MRDRMVVNSLMMSSAHKSHQFFGTLAQSLATFFQYVLCGIVKHHISLNKHTANAKYYILYGQGPGFRGGEY